MYITWTKCFLGWFVASLLLPKVRRRARGVVTRPMKREKNTRTRGHRVTLHVNKRQKIRHYRARYTEEEEERQMVIFYFVLRARKLRYYGDVIHSFYWKCATEHDGGV